jgi:hypothetical protein
MPQTVLTLVVLVFGGLWYADRHARSGAREEGLPLISKATYGALLLLALVIAVLWLLL